MAAPTSGSRTPSALWCGMTVRGRKIHAIEVHESWPEANCPGPTLCGLDALTDDPAAWRWFASTARSAPATYCQRCLDAYLDAAGAVQWPDAYRPLSPVEQIHKAAADVGDALRRAFMPEPAPGPAQLDAAPSPDDPAVIPAVVVRHPSGRLTVWQSDPQGFAGVGAFLGTVSTTTEEP